MKAKDIMTTQVVSVKPETSVIEIAQKLMDHKISAVPVLDASGRLIGIVRRSPSLTMPMSRPDASSTGTALIL